LSPITEIAIELAPRPEAPMESAENRDMNHSNNVELHQVGQQSELPWRMSLVQLIYIGSNEKIRVACEGLNGSIRKS
jgi:hypothetical protein